MWLPDIFQKAHKHQGWKPTTSTLWVLGPVAVFTTLLLALVAASAHRYLTHGTVIEVTKSNFFVSAVFQYLPIILAIPYGIIWGWIDLDVKRLAPWQDLAKCGGGFSRDSLSLQYPVDFPLSVPFRSAKRRQWLVFCSSITVIAVYWGVTPLMGSIYATRNVDNSITSNVIRTIGLNQPFGNSPSQGPAFLYSGLATLWFSQDLPSFVTNASTFTPFRSDVQVLRGVVNSSITYRTTRYTSELECWTPNSTTVNNNTGMITFDDGLGCVARDVIPVPQVGLNTNDSFIGYYVGWYSDDQSLYSLSTSGCPQEASHRFLAVWMRLHTAQIDFKDSNSATALFCEPKYSQQEVMATMSLPDLKVTSFIPLGDETPLAESSFNITAFEYILGTGFTPNTGSVQQRADIPYTGTIQQSTLLSSIGVGFTDFNMNNMVLFGIGATHLPLDGYLNATNLARSYREAHQLLFVLALQDPLKNAALEANGTTATLTSAVQAVVIIPALAIMLIVLLGAIFLLTISHVILSEQRKMHLQYDPNNIPKTLYQLDARQVLSTLRLYCGTDTLLQNAALPDIKSSQDSVKDNQKLQNENHGHSMSDGGANTRTNSISNPETDQEQLQWNIEPGLSKKVALVTFASLLAGVLLTIIVLKVRSDQQQGLLMPELSGFGQQVALNYFPTLFATLSEPIWMEITRWSCIYLPYHELASSISTAKSSLDVSYAAYPPQLIISRTLRNRHFFISALAITGLLTNILTIAMNNLFYLSSVSLVSTEKIQPLYKDSTAMSEWATQLGLFGPASLATYALYITMANLSDSTAKLPPWLGQEQFFIPNKIPSESRLGSSFMMTTTGIGAFLKCEALTLEPSNASYALSFDAALSNSSITARYTDTGGAQFECVPSALFNQNGGTQIVVGDPSSSKAMEIVKQLSVPIGTNDTAHQEFCNERLLFGWIRTKTVLKAVTNATSSLPATTNTVDAESATLSATMLSCQAEVYSAPYQVLVSTDGTVLSSNRTGPISTDPILSTSFQNITKALNDKIQTTTQPFPYNPIWHNDTIASDWPNYLMKLLTNSTAVLDASKPPPNAADAIEQVSAVYSRSWASILYIMSPYLDKPSAAEETKTTSSGQRIEIVRKLFVNPAMFWLAAVILVENIVLCLVLLFTMPRPFLPRVPVSIGSVVAFFEASHCLDDFQNGNGDSGDTTSFNGQKMASGWEDGFDMVSTDSTSRKDKEPLYAYGHFIGADGKARVGIDRYPHAVPLNLKERRGWRFSGIGST